MTATHSFGRRLIPQIVDDRSKSSPERIVYSFPLDPQLTSWHHVTARVLANAVDTLAWKLAADLGRSSTFETVSYIGPHDIRYVMVVLACIKAGYQALLLSPRNSLDGNMALLEDTDCKIWMNASSTFSAVSEILKKREMVVVNVPGLFELLEADPVPHFPYEKVWKDASKDPFCILHTSGTTGLPKPIRWNNGLLSTVDAVRLLPSVEGDNDMKPWTSLWSPGDRLYSAFPFYHGAGMVFNLLMNNFYETHGIIGPSSIIPNVDFIASLAEQGLVDIWNIVPSLVDEIGESFDVIDKFANSKLICASGGPVRYAPASKVNSVVRVLNLTGTTEGLFIGNLVPDREDWIYFCWHPWSGFEFREIEPGLYEHHVVKNEHANLFQGLFHTFSDVHEMSLKDLYAKHPTKPNHWIYRGRADELIVLSNAQKFAPSAVETLVSSHPNVAGCLVIGSGKFQAGLLIEPKNSQVRNLSERNEMVDAIYGLVQQANELSPSYGTIGKDYIMFTRPDKPFLRTDKRTIKRRATLQMYAGDIDSLYKEQELVQSAIEIIQSADFSSLGDIQSSLLELVGSLGSGYGDLSPQDDLFRAGVDSLFVLRLTKSLRLMLSSKGIEPTAISSRTIYTEPTIERLSLFLAHILRMGQPIGSSAGSPIQKRDMQRQMARLREFYSPRGESITVLLTGSTGSLGSYILARLMSLDHVATIYCLNRAEVGLRLQTDVNICRGLGTDFPKEKVKFLHADLSKPYFGLRFEDYSELLHEVSHVIHNQWPVNFNWDLESFEPHIRGTRRLIDLCKSTRKSSSLFFISTIGVATQVRGAPTIPEAPIHSDEIDSNGYICAKTVCEMIIQDAVARTGINASICRVGQIAGPVRTGEGQWNRNEWLPTIISTSHNLGILPSSLGDFNRIDWIPVDILADVIIELAGLEQNMATGQFSSQTSSHTKDVRFYHAINPNTTTWSELVPVVAERLGESLKILSWNEWVDALRRVHDENMTIGPEELPGLKLLDFFESLKSGSQSVPLETGLSVARSKTLSSLVHVSPEWMDLWLQQWGY
ncbi:hypothetical protein PFICI_08077 [Pestalotiopsis fici W106-1]|uniref:Carrier domain-containing protein n=1 Tax=Pestalotiopsis fici (strain W106-1 / CGMCC3.15140) TaxID=1229662 RepID=W3X329_PESFW|nr:uncharacterized protein PFICI_08077 [Pestalotiopsis fici W106-1]ETS80548.1 hypothetical protein PFICI_08077 [Pestalotiopsis fici W106-1]